MQGKLSGRKPFKQREQEDKAAAEPKEECTAVNHTRALSAHEPVARGLKEWLRRRHKECLTAGR